MMASDAGKRPYRHLPNPRELNARLWKDPEFHMRLWTDPTLRDAYVTVIDKALLDAITGKEKMEVVADALSDIVMTQVEGSCRSWACGTTSGDVSNLSSTSCSV